MTKANKPGYLLPLVPEPDENICICVPVPKDWRHIQAFMGQIVQLGYWYTWERDPEKTGTIAARVWREIYECISDEVNCAMTTGCGCGNNQPTNQRYTEDGILEVSYDGGITYEPAPELDSRMSGTVAPPIPGEDGTDKKCAAAASAQEWVKQNLIDSLEEGATFAQLNAAAVAIIALLGVTGIGILIAAAAAAIFAAGVAAVQAAFTTGVWADFRCILYCHIEDDGSFTEEGWQAVKADILDQFTGAVSAILYNWTNSVGPVGLTNSARSLFVLTADCSECACNNCSNLGDWIPMFGTIIDQSPGYIKMQSADNGSGVQSCRITTYAAGATCCLVSIGASTGAGWTQGTYYDCSTDTPTNLPSPPENMCTYDINTVNIFGGSFTVEYLFADCP